MLIGLSTVPAVRDPSHRMMVFWEELQMIVWIHLSRRLLIRACMWTRLGVFASFDVSK